MDKKNKVFKQKDHIILPKATLKRFANPETNMITYLDLSNPKSIFIKEKYPDSFHTKPNYYIPEYDDIVKKYETMIGNYCKLITDICNKKVDKKINAQQLKKDIIDITNIQFQRAIIADDELLGKLLKQFEKQHEQESLFYIRRGMGYPKEFLDRQQEFNQAKKDINSFRYYAQRIIGQENQRICDAYRDCSPQILVIPDEVSSTFILSPQHFVGYDIAARIIISPRIALALYPISLTKDGELIKYLTKEDVDCLVPKAIESALSMENNYREIIGEENYLNCIKNKLQIYKSIICNLVDDIALVKGGKAILNSSQSFLELAVSIKLFEPDCHKVIIEIDTNARQFWQEEEYSESKKIFETWEFALVFVNNSELNISNKQIKIAQNIEEAITMF